MFIQVRYSTNNLLSDNCTVPSPQPQPTYFFTLGHSDPSVHSWDDRTVHISQAAHDQPDALWLRRLRIDLSTSCSQWERTTCPYPEARRGFPYRGVNTRELHGARSAPRWRVRVGSASRLTVWTKIVNSRFANLYCSDLSYFFCFYYLFSN